ncbi:hypothetical protein [Pseudomonas aeruginosa]|uniref:hypothetical protein n=1 Tax=Pseudomonas aeruginosa TaxID=287 RepID=UPI00111BF429|nr:hypothetical protein [Pseudomonas aeruginosa]MDP5897411.1 hypothetical protein [Pseudomonas aeruginosa]MDU0667837.1 hypothetical protein [Pseudomonas aeruginosa]HCK0364862.1 hypothetical protein [Pseudomonas aeruginosa]
MDFFNPGCQSGPFNQVQFGLCDDQNTTRAYVDTTTPAKWIATVENPESRAVTFTAIDKCVIQDDAEPARGRCDGMLSTEDLLYLVELKDQRAGWQSHAILQLESTILFLRQYHPADLNRFRHKKAFACNKRHTAFAVIDHELKRRFFQNYGFRIDVQATVLVLPPV